MYVFSLFFNPKHDFSLIQRQKKVHNFWTKLGNSDYSDPTPTNQSNLPLLQTGINASEGHQFRDPRSYLALYCPARSASGDWGKSVPH